MISIKNYKIKLIFIVLLYGLQTLTAKTSDDTSSQYGEFKECLAQEGNDIKSCLQSLPSIHRKKLFKKLTPQQRKQFFYSLKIEDYEKFLDDYSMYDWIKLFSALTAQEQERWPQDIYEQRYILSNMRYTYFIGSSWYGKAYDYTSYIPGAQTFLGLLCIPAKNASHKQVEKRFQDFIKKHF